MREKNKRNTSVLVFPYVSSLVTSSYLYDAQFMKDKKEEIVATHIPHL